MQGRGEAASPQSVQWRHIHLHVKGSSGIKDCEIRIRQVPVVRDSPGKRFEVHESGTQESHSK